MKICVFLTTIQSASCHNEFTFNNALTRKLWNNLLEQIIEGPTSLKGEFKLLISSTQGPYLVKLKLTLLNSLLVAFIMFMGC